MTDLLWLASDVRGARVTVGDHHVGQVTDLVLDASCEFLIGLEVEARSGRRYFLPGPLAGIDDDGVTAASALHLVDAPEYYQRHGIGLAMLQQSAGHTPVVDVAIDPASLRVIRFRLGDGRSLRRLPGRVAGGQATHRP